MNKKITIPTLLLATVAAVSFMLPQTAAARDRNASDRDHSPKFVHYERGRQQYRHKQQQYRHHQNRHAPRWYRHYQRHHAYGHRTWGGHPGYFANKHAWKKHYRRMERKHHHQPRHSHGRNYDSNIHFRIDYWN